MTVPRPVLICAYGEVGRPWLKKTAGLLRSREQLKRLIDERLIQFWLISSQDLPVEENIELIRDDADAETLRELLDRGLRVRTRTLGQQLDIVYVFERLSIFAEDTAPLSQFRHRLDAARRVDAQPENSRELDLQWLSLVDAIRSVRRPPRVIEQHARKILALTEPPCRSVVIDRTDEGGGVIDRDMADECFQLLTVGLVSSAYVFADHAAAPPPGWLQEEAQPGFAHPVSILKLEHRQSDIHKVYAHWLNLVLLAADGRDIVGTVPLDPPDVARIVEQMLDAATSKRPISSGPKLEKRRAFVALVQRALVTQSGDALSDVRRARSAVKPYARAAGSASPLILASLSTSTTLVLIGLVLVLLVLGWILLRRRRVPKIADEHLASSETANRDGALHGAPREIDDELSRLEQLLLDLKNRQHVRLGGHGSAGDLREVVWSLASETPPFTWRLHSYPEGPARPRPDGDLYRRIAEACIDALDAGIEPPSAFDSAVDRIARQQLDTGAEIKIEILQQALSGASCANVQESVRRERFFLNTGVILSLRDVSWFSDSTLHLADRLAALENPTKNLARTLDHGNTECTVRVAIGQPVHWKDISTLRFLERDGP